MRIKKSWITTGVILAIASYFLIDVFTQNNDGKYLRELEKMRTDKNMFFKESHESPITDKANFTGLNYFEPDLTYRCIATFDKDGKKEVFRMGMTDGAKEQYIVAGKLTLTLRNKEYVLTAFKRQHDRDNQLFLPFTDQTNGTFTYGGGRYLDLKYQGKSTILVDFNQSYQPYCAYNKSFVCPIPPAENHIDQDVAAGERMPE